MIPSLRMKRVLVIANNLKQASFRLRVAALIELLARQGFDLVVQLRPKQWRARRALMQSARDYHAVLLQRKLLDPGDARLLRRAARRIVYDVDDAVMFPRGNESWFTRWRLARRLAATSEIADHVVAGNDYLADVFRKRGKQVTVLPTCVDPAHYQVKTHRETATPTLVWIGSSSTAPYLQRSIPVLEEAAKQTPGLRLLTIADTSVTSSVIPIDHIPWSAATEAESLCRGDIGIIPTPLEPWTLGKSGFKIIQYMAAGLPTIASPVGANEVLVRHGETGLLPARFEDWPTAIATLARDTDMRAKQGMAARNLVEQHYSIHKAAEFWAQLLD